MGGEQAAMVLSQLRRDNIEAKGGTWSIEEENEFARRRARNSKPRVIPITPPPGSWDDCVIDPADTRLVLGLGLSASGERTDRADCFGLFRM